MVVIVHLHLFTTEITTPYLHSINGHKESSVVRLELSLAVHCYGFTNVVGAIRKDVLGCRARKDGKRTWAFCGKGRGPSKYVH